MPPARLPFLFLVAVLLITGCGSSDSDEGEPGKTGPTATATTPEVPPGASARGCGETTVAGTSGLRVTGVGCDVGRGVVAAWSGKAACEPSGGGARSSCSAYGGYRCLGAATDRGVAVSCARPGSSIAFLSAKASLPERE